MLIRGESVQIGEHGVALHLAGIGDVDMVGVREHGHNALVQRLPAIGKVDAVAQGFAHFRLAVGSRKPAAGFVVVQHDPGIHQHFSIGAVEFVYDLPALLQHGHLVLSHRHAVCLEGSDVSSLGNGIGVKAHGDSLAALVEAPHADFRLDSGIPFQPCGGHQIHIIKAQLRQGRKGRLDADGGLLRIDAAA